MRTKSIFGVKSITNLIYGLLMIAPFVAILSRVIYVQANPNAKDSYSGANGYQINYKYETNEIETASDLKVGNIYKITINGVVDAQQYASYFYAIYNMQGYNVNFEVERLNTQYLVLDLRPTYVAIRTSDYTGLITIQNTQITYPFSFDAVLYQYTGSTDFNYTNFSSTEFNVIDNVDITNNGTLDNAFEYSLSQFTKDNDIGVINFFGWFEGMFLNQSNVHNMVYLNFANWYMNYALLVSSSYLLFLALIWFVNYIRRILDKSMNHDFGGF